MPISPQPSCQQELLGQSGLRRRQPRSKTMEVRGRVVWGPSGLGFRGLWVWGLGVWWFWEGGGGVINYRGFGGLGGN